MPWVLEKIKHPAWTAKFGHDLHDTGRHDPYGLACVIEDRGDGIAYLSNATGNGKLPSHHELFKMLAALGFQRIRWVRAIDEKLVRERRIAEEP